MQEELAKRNRRRSGLPAVSRYFIFKDDEQNGPMTLAQLQGFFRRGEVSSEHFYWTEGMQDWKPVEEITDLLKQPEIPAKAGRHARKGKGHKTKRKNFKQVFFVTLTLIVFVLLIAFLIFITGNIL